MNLQEFTAKYSGKKVDFDGYYGAQCMDIYRQYLQEVWQVPQTPKVVGASQVFASLPAEFDKFRNTPLGMPKPGDVITWSEQYTKNGHIAIVISATLNTVTVFEQNNPLGNACTIATHSYKNIIGWFRPKTATAPTPMTNTEKLLVLFSFLPQQVQDQIKTTAKIYTDRVTQRTNGEYSYELSFAEASAPFHTISGPSSDGLTVTYANPSEIVIEGHKVEVATSKEFNAVCLVYDDRQVIGDPPNHPVDNPVYQEGFNVYSIPLSWFTNIGDPSQPFQYFSDAFRLFFAHEGSHSKYFLANTLGQAGARDKTHDPNPYQQWGAAMEPPDFFIDLLIELKPYWNYLTQTANLGSTMSMIAFSYKAPGASTPTVYIPIMAKFVPVADENTFLELGGSWNNVKALSDAEFNSVIKPFLAQQTVIG